MRGFLLVLVLGCGHGQLPPIERVVLPPQLTTPRSTLVLGDLHGTQELPAFVGGVVAQLAAHQPVVLALEIPADQTLGIPAFLDSDGGPAARVAVLRDPFWRDAYQDGRRSDAMLALIDQARQLRAAGKRVDVDRFDPVLPGPPSQESREEAMAQHLIATRAARPDAVLVVYVGNLHAVRTEHEAIPGFAWMARRMARAGVVFTSLGPRWQSGTAWTCPNADPADCGATPVKGKGGPAGIITMGATPGGHYDGWFDVGPVQASPPAAAPPARLAGAPREGARRR